MRPKFQLQWHLTHAGFGTYVASSEGEVRVLQAPINETLIPLIDGSRTLAEIRVLLLNSYDDGSVQRALMVLEQAELLTEAGAHESSESTYWQLFGTRIGEVEQRHADAAVEVLSIGRECGQRVVATLASLGIAIKSDAAFRVVVTHDYLDPALAELNQDALQRGLPWMIVRPSGRNHWIGPLFVPGRTACWACLATRLRGNIFTAKGVEASPVTSVVTETIVASEATKWLLTNRSHSLEGRLQTLDTVSLHLRAHSVAQFPQCKACGREWNVGQRWHKIRRTKDETTSAALYRHRSALTGIFSNLERVPNEAGVYIHRALLNSILRPDYAGSASIIEREWVCGKAFHPDQSRAGCMAEGIERYSVQFHGDEPRIRARYRDLAPAAIDPNTLCLQRAGDGGASESFDSVVESEWVPARSLTHRSKRFVSAGYCYLGYGAPWWDSNSNGCAAANSFEEAALRGFLELVERDAVTIWWYNRTKRPSIDLDAFGGHAVGQIRDYVREEKRILHVLDVTTDFGIPVMVAVTAAAGGADVVIGSAASLGVETAIEGAILEAVVLLTGPKPWGSPGRYNRKSAFLQWRRSARLDAFPYLRPGRGVPPPTHARIPRGTPSECLAWCVTRAQRLGLEVLTVDMTRPEVGFPVVRAIAPGMRYWKPLFAPGRLFDTPVTLGWRKTRIKERDLNPVPFFF